MKFSSREDIEAPAEVVFGMLTDFGALEVAAMRRGISQRRLDGMAAQGVGMSWDMRFQYRGKSRALLATLITFEVPERLEFEATSLNLGLRLGFTLVPHSKRRTRLLVELDVRPRTLGARLMVQSAKLGKSRLNRRYADRIRLLALEIEDRAARAIA
jgi:hypothetical protein